MGLGLRTRDDDDVDGGEERSQTVFRGQRKTHLVTNFQENSRRRARGRFALTRSQLIATTWPASRWVRAPLNSCSSTHPPDATFSLALEHILSLLRVNLFTQKFLSPRQHSDPSLPAVSFANVIHILGNDVRERDTYETKLDFLVRSVRSKNTMSVSTETITWETNYMYIQCLCQAHALHASSLT